MGELKKKGRLPTVEELERVNLRSVSLTFRAESEVRFRVEPDEFSEYRSFELVFSALRSFTGAETFSGARLCIRGPSPTEGGVVYEFEIRGSVPFSGRSLDIETDREIKARVVAARVAVEDVYRPKATAVSIVLFTAPRRLAELEILLRGLAGFRVDFVEPERPIAYTTFTTTRGTVAGSYLGCEARIEIEHGRPPGTFRLTIDYPTEVQEVFRQDLPGSRELARKFDPQIDALIASLGGTILEDQD